MGDSVRTDFHRAGRAGRSGRRAGRRAGCSAGRRSGSRRALPARRQQCRAVLRGAPGHADLAAQRRHPRRCRQAARDSAPRDDRRAGRWPGTRRLGRSRDRPQPGCWRRPRDWAAASVPAVSQADDKIISTAWVRYVQALKAPVGGVSYGDPALAADAPNANAVLFASGCRAVARELRRASVDGESVLRLAP